MTTTMPTHASKTSHAEVMAAARDANVKFVRLWFNDILGRVNYPLFARLQHDPRAFASTLERAIQICAVATLFFVGLLLGLVAVLGLWGLPLDARTLDGQAEYAYARESAPRARAAAGTLYVYTEEATRALGCKDEVGDIRGIPFGAVAMALAPALGRSAAQALVKRAVDQGIENDLASGLLLERGLFELVFHTDDSQIGVQSFLANGPGKAEFTGR